MVGVKPAALSRGKKSPLTLQVKSKQSILKRAKKVSANQKLSRNKNNQSASSSQKVISKTLKRPVRSPNVKRKDLIQNKPSSKDIKTPSPVKGSKVSTSHKKTLTPSPTKKSSSLKKSDIPATKKTSPDKKTISPANKKLLSPAIKKTPTPDSKKSTSATKKSPSSSTKKSTPLVTKTQSTAVKKTQSVLINKTKTSSSAKVTRSLLKTASAVITRKAKNTVVTKKVFSVPIPKKVGNVIKTKTSQSFPTKSVPTAKRGRKPAGRRSDTLLSSYVQTTPKRGRPKKHPLPLKASVVPDNKISDTSNKSKETKTNTNLINFSPTKTARKSIRGPTNLQDSFFTRLQESHAQNYSVFIKGTLNPQIILKPCSLVNTRVYSSAELELPIEATEKVTLSEESNKASCEDTCKDLSGISEETPKENLLESVEVVTHDLVNTLLSSVEESVGQNNCLELENLKKCSFSNSESSVQAPSTQNPFKFKAFKSRFNFGKTKQKRLFQCKRFGFSSIVSRPGRKHRRYLSADDIHKLIFAKSSKKTSQVPLEHKAQHISPTVKESSESLADTKTKQKNTSRVTKTYPVVRLRKLSIDKYQSQIKPSPARVNKTFPVVSLRRLSVENYQSRIKLSNSVEGDLKLFVSEAQNITKVRSNSSQISSSKSKNVSRVSSNNTQKVVSSHSKNSKEATHKSKYSSSNRFDPKKKRKHSSPQQGSEKKAKQSGLKGSVTEKKLRHKDSSRHNKKKKSVEDSEMDFLQCGRCSSTFTSLKLFISHKKKNDCKASTSLSTEKPVKKSTPLKSATQKESSSNNKNAQKNRSGFRCGECDGCLRRVDCAECQNCLDNKLTTDSKLTKRCLLKQCETLYENQVYQVEKLVSKRLYKARTEYLVKWKGYPDSENTWEPEANVLSPTLVAEFEERQKKAREKGSLSDRASNSHVLGKRDTRAPSPASSSPSLSHSESKRPRLESDLKADSVSKPETEPLVVPQSGETTEGETQDLPTPDQMTVTVQPPETVDEDSSAKANDLLPDTIFPTEGVSALGNEEEEENPNLTEIKLFLASEFDSDLLPSEPADGSKASTEQDNASKASADPKVQTKEVLSNSSETAAAAVTETLAVSEENPPVAEEAILTYTTLDGAISKTVKMTSVLPNVPQRNARKSMKSSGNRYTSKEVSSILKEIKNDVGSRKQVAIESDDEESLDDIDEEEIAAIEKMNDYFDDEDEDTPRRGRHTKQAALDFIRTVCHNIKQRQKSEAELEAERNRRRRKRMLLTGVDGEATDSYEKNLDLSNAVSAIYIQNPDEPSSYILVKGDQDQISFLEGANLSPQVIVNAKEPLREATPWDPIPSRSPSPTFSLPPPPPPPVQTVEEATPEGYEQEVEELPSTSGAMMEESFEDLFGMDDSSWGMDPSLSDTSSIMGGDISGTEGPPPAPIPRKRTGRPSLPPTERKVLTPFGGAKRKPGRPPKSESLARLAMLRELQGDSANSEDTLESAPSRGDDTLPSDLLGMYERRRQKPRQFDEYIDPDTLLKDEPENVVVPGRRSTKHQDEDFEPPTLPKPPTGRPRGRPPKHYNINDITDEMDFRRKFIKTMPQKAEGGRGRGKKNRVFVVMPDGTMVEVSGNDREKAIARATAKMEVLRKNVFGRGRGAAASDDNGGNLIGGMRRRTDLRPAIEECTTDTVDDPSMLKLPNTVQLVESELPLTEAENGDKLVGMFLFRQIYSPNDPNLFCLMCRNKYPLTYPVDLEKHYHVIHELGVQIFKAEFSENIVFVCVPSDVSEDTMLNSGCRFCDETLKTLSEVRSHYPDVHGKNVRLVPENSVMELGESFYCSICSHESKDFNSHHKHMKEQHRMHTYACRFCNFCTPKPNRLRTHVKQRHLQEQPGPHLQCSVCSVYVHGKERLNKHILLSHAVQTGPRTWSCAKCLQPCGDARELMSHIHKCPFLRGQNQVAAVEAAGDAPAEDDNSSSGKSTLFYKCTLCTLTFSSEDDVKRHMAEGIHPAAGEELSVQGDINASDLSDPAVVALGGSGVSTSETTAEESTCFLCHLRFPSKDQCLLHQHHIHMRWVAKGVVDYSPEELQDLPPEVIVAETLEMSQLLKNSMRGPPPTVPPPIEPVQESTSEPLTAEEEEARALERALMEDLDEPMQENSKETPSVPVAGTQPLADSAAATREFSLCMADIPSDQKLSELGFPTKVGHFCHLCDAVIKSYALYYLHMHNLHGLERRFQCIVSACSRTYHSPLAFQRHAQTHNQKSEDVCSMCDLVFNSDDELQEHLLSPEHATKYMRVQEKYNRSEPRNYRCKVCHSWFGLFATFVKHMETEGHQYQCQHCGLLFVQPGPRRNHIQSIHPELANICEICGIQMPNSQALWSHLSLHSIVHECPKCHRRFLQKEQLTAHMEIHAPPTPCPWEGCNRKLSTKVGLYNHLRMHRGDADYKCSVCNKGFFKKKTLEAHMRIHEEHSNGLATATVSAGRGRGRQSKQNQLELNSNLVFQHQNEEFELTDAEQVLAEQQMAEALQIDMQESGETTTASAEPMSSVELIQLICAGCLNGFDSEEQFTQHACAGHATPEQAEAAVALLSGQDQQIILQSDNPEDMDTQIATQHTGLQTLSASDEDLAAQLAKAVAEATGPGGGRVTVSFAGGQPVAMVDGQVVTMATIGEDGQPIEATLESLIASGAVAAGNEGLSIAEAGLLQDVAQPMEETQMLMTTPLEGEGEAAVASQAVDMEVLEHEGDEIIPDQNFIEHAEGEDETAVKEETEVVVGDFAITKEEGTEFIVAASDVGDGQVELKQIVDAGEEALVSVTESEYVETEENVMSAENADTEMEDVSTEKQECVEEPLPPKDVMISEENAYLLTDVDNDALNSEKDENKESEIREEEGNSDQPLATETVMISEEEAYLLAGVQNEGVEQQEEPNKDDESALAITMEDGQEDMNIVMMVGDENGELDGNQPYSVVKVPTADGGEQVLLIPLTTTEGGDTVLALPDNLTLAEQDGGQMAVTFEQEEEHVQYMTLPVMSEDEQETSGAELQKTDTLQEEVPDVTDTL